jgi:glycosyltransferase involved in cell wall biosynthesis
MTQHSPGGATSGGKSCKVLVSHLGRNGGGPKFAYFLFDSLSARESLDVSYLIAAGSDQRRMFEETGRRSLLVPTYETKAQLIVGLPRLLVTALKIRRYIQRECIEVVINSMESIYQGLMAPVAIPRGVRYISCVHDADDHPGDAHWLKRLARFGERLRADEFVAFSRTVADTLSKRKFVGNRIIHETIHGVFGLEEDLRPRTSEPISGTLRVGFLGRLGKYKGLEILCEAIAIVRSRGLDVSASIFGAGPESALATTPLGGNCDWHVGWIKDAEIPRILDSFDILALPYVEASQSGVLAYALARGVPVVAMPVGGLVEQVNGAGCGVVAHSVSAEAFADALAKLLRDGQLRQQLSRNALAAGRSIYSWERVGDDFAKWITRSG